MDHIEIFENRYLGHDCLRDGYQKSDFNRHGGYGAAFFLPIAYYSGSWWLGNGEYESRIRYCPICGINLDEELEKITSTVLDNILHI